MAKRKKIQRIGSLRGIWPVSLVLLAEVFLIPLGVVALFGGQEPSVEEVSPLPSPAETARVGSEEVCTFDREQTVILLTEAGAVEMTLEDYLWGVTAAEMPAAFAEEALKAQAVAARTGTLYRLAHPSAGHPEADVCTDYGCCQAYIPRETALARWGASAALYEEKISRAVAETDGMVVTYEGAVIQALFHSSSDGTTRSSAEVWGGNLPYLTGVESPEGEEVPNYYSVVEVTGEAFRTAIQENYPAADLVGSPGDWSFVPVYGESGLLTELKVGGVSVRASELRSLFSLRSSSFEVEGKEDTVVFYVTGYGHGVGMSQYGANAMAKAGAGYVEILEWYYSGAGVEQMGETGL